MATGKVIGKLLKFKGFKAVDLAFERGNELHMAATRFQNSQVSHSGIWSSGRVSQGPVTPVRRDAPSGLRCTLHPGKRYSPQG